MNNCSSADLINCSTATRELTTSSPTKNKLNNLINLSEEDRNSKRFKPSESLDNLNKISQNENHKIEIDQPKGKNNTENKQVKNSFLKLFK